MLIRIDDEIQLEVAFDPLDREVGYNDEIRFTIHEKTSAPVRMFAADSTSLLLTPDQAELLAQALVAAVEASRRTLW